MNYISAAVNLLNRHRLRVAAAAIAALFVFILIIWLIRRHRAHTLSVDEFTQRWKDLQRNCMTRKTWPLAIIEADDLLDEALRRRNYKGKTTGERLVAAQHTLTNNESAWLGHKLRKRIPDTDVRKLRKQDVFEALTGFRQALRDLGALKKDGEQ
jgi:uncharacterized protein YoxC